MRLTETQEFLYLFIPLFVAILSNLVIAVLMTREIRKHNADVWERLGRPSLLNQSIKTNFLMSNFIYSRSYRKIGNKRVRILGDIELALGAVVIILFILLVIETGKVSKDFTFTL